MLAFKTAILNISSGFYLPLGTRKGPGKNPEAPKYFSFSTKGARVEVQNELRFAYSAVAAEALGTDSERIRRLKMEPVQP